MLKKAIDFIKRDIWRIRLSKLSPKKAFLLKPIMIIILALRGFDEDKCQLRASALTFYSLLSIVPVLAMAFGVAKGFGFENLLEKLLIEKIPGQQEIITQMIGFARKFLENTKGGMIAGIGVALLFWTVIKVLGNIEQSFNDIWGIKNSRTMGRKFSDYLSILFICPILLIISSSVTVAVASYARIIIEKISFLGPISSFLFTLLNFLPYCVIWLLFSFIYIFMPNTKVHFKSGVLAGIAAGTIYQGVQWAYISFQVGAAKYNAIYGSFAALPLFLVWLQLSWLIVLFGAEIAFALQNLETYEFEPDCLSVSYKFKLLLTLRIMQFLAKDFCEAKRPSIAGKLSHELEIPIRLVRQILYELVAAGLVSEIKLDEEKGVAYQPAQSTHELTIKNIIDILESRGTDNIPVIRSAEFKKIEEALNEFKTLINSSPKNMLIEKI